MFHMFPLFEYLKMQIIAFDMPAFGKTIGKSSQDRNDKIIMEQNGPASVV